MNFERVVLVSRQTELEALVERFQTRSQSEFYLEQSGQTFAPIAAFHERYQAALQQVRAAIPQGIQLQVLERRNLPRYRFDEKDVVVAVGPDGLVANVAKYIHGQPLLAVNPDPDSIDGVLLPLEVAQLARALRQTLAGRAVMDAVTMSEVITQDGQRLRAVNDIYVGARTHVSARYQLQLGDRSEEQSSSGLIVSTGVGSTGWLRSVYAGALGVARTLSPSLQIAAPDPLPWDTNRLMFNVREPWPSLQTGAALVSGTIHADEQLLVVSRMPEGGVIFADGMERDYLEFNHGAHARIGIAEQRLHLVRPH